LQAAPLESDLRANLMFIIGLGITTVLVESLLLHFAGTTPGKALFGVRVVNQDGTRLSLGQAFSRTLRVWVLGMGAGFMLFTIIAGIAGHIRLTGRGITAWDEQLGLRVEHPEITGAHVLKVVGYLLIFLFALMLILAPLMPPPPEPGGTTPVRGTGERVTAAF
ncbi:MAG: RDD family protein, partial [Gemmatimonadetes bacterium]|nr:RDD family protein [Gemmatimonadota bacterium]